MISAPAAERKDAIGDSNINRVETVTQLEMNQIVALFNGRHYQELELSARNLLERHPHSGFVWKVLGAALQLQGKESIPALQQACQLLPADAEAHNNLGVALRNSGQLDEAESSFTRAIALKNDFADAHNNLGMVLRDLTQFDLAVASYRRAVMWRPNFAEAHNNLGNALRSIEQFDEAISSYHRALQFKPDFADAYLNLSIVLKPYSQVEAEDHCRKALELDPNSSAAAVFMANLKADQGNFIEAEAWFRRGISIDPDAPEAWAGIARIRKMTPNDAPWLAEVERIAQMKLPPRREVYLCYAMGKYHDDVKEYERAFQNYERANGLIKTLGKKYDRNAEALEVNRLCAYFDREWMNRNRPNANRSMTPVIVVGMPRSGTSLAEQIIASHPAAFGAGELPFWKAALALHEMEIQKGMSSEEILPKLADNYLRMLQGLSADSLRIVDKMPVNFMCIGLILAALPNARIIHMQRNPIDTCLSIYFQHFEASQSFGNDLEDLAHYYAQYRRVMEHWEKTLPENTILHVPYEELVGDQEGWSRKMMEFIDLPWDSRCLDFHQTARTVNTASNWQVRQKINKSSVERWRNYEKFLGPLLGLIS